MEKMDDANKDDDHQNTNKDGSTSTSSNDGWSSYLALIPRGLQHIVSDIVRDELEGRYEFRIEVLTTPDMKDSNILPLATQGVLDSQAKKIQRKKKQKEQNIINNPPGRKITQEDYCAQPVGSVLLDTSMLVSSASPLTTSKLSIPSSSSSSLPHQEQPPQTQNEEKVLKQQQKKQKQKQQIHLSLGYNAKHQPVWNCAGQLTGSLWYKFDTTAPAAVVGTQLRCFGPLLALIASTTDLTTPVDRCCTDDTTTTPTTTGTALRLGPQNSLSEATQDLGSWINGLANYDTAFDRALRVWYDHTQACWPWYNFPDNNNNKQDDNDEALSLKSLPERYKTGHLSFRLSCVRDSSTMNRRQKFLYTRQELLATALDWGMVPRTPYQETWTVNLTQFDIEVTLLIQDTMVAIGLALRPYSRVCGRSFASGAIPPDISAPYVGDALSGLVRLRPTTAHILLHLAQVQAGEVVLDPCVGIGTIPVEVESFYGSPSVSSKPSVPSAQVPALPIPPSPPLSSRAIGLGGDLVLSDAAFASIASEVVSCALPLPSSTTAATNSAPRPYRKTPSPSYLAAWDASHLPIRTGSIDVIVSDLPFGKQCLSANALTALLPLMVAEMARVLTPSSTLTSSSLPSRMVLLCGSYELVLQALEPTYSYWRFPCRAIFPVSIGGLLAWIVQVERNEMPFSCGIRHHLERVRKMTAKRDLVAHQRRRAVEQHEKNQPESNGKTKATTSPNTKTKAKKSRIQS